jgi:hypothetical protein
LSAAAIETLPSRVMSLYVSSERLSRHFTV